MPRDVATAQAELEEARLALETLRERVRQGDQDVTPEQLATQRELLGFAQLRVEAAQRTETRIREEERAALGAAAKEAAEALITGPGAGEIADAMRTAVDSIAALTALVRTRNQQIAEVGSTLIHLDDDLKQAGIVTGPWGSKRYGLWGDRKHVIVPGVGTAPYVDVAALTVTAVVAGLGASQQAGEEQRRHAELANGIWDSEVRKTLEAHPWLADVLRATPEEYAAADRRGKAMLTEQGRRPLPEAVEG